VLPIPTAPSPFSTAAAAAAAAAAASAAAAARAAATAAACQQDDDHRPPHRVLTCPQIGQHPDQLLHLQHQRQLHGSLPPGAAEGGCVGVGGSIGTVSSISAVQLLLPQCPWELAVCCSDGGSSAASRLDGFSTATTMTTADASVRTPVTPPVHSARAGSGGDGSSAAGCDTVRPLAAPIPVPVQTAALAAAHLPAVSTVATGTCSPAVQMAATSPSFPAAMAAAAEAAQAEAEEAYAAACRDSRAAATAIMSRSTGPASMMHLLRHHVRQQHPHHVPQHHHYSPQLAPASRHQHQHQLLHAGSAKENSSSSAGQAFQPSVPEAVMSLGPFSPSVHDTPSVLQLPQPLHHPQPLRHQPLPHITRPHAVPAAASGAPHGSNADIGTEGSSAFWSGTSAPTSSSCPQLLVARHLLPHAAAFSTCADSTSSPVSNTPDTDPTSPPLGCANAAVPAAGGFETGAAEGDGRAGATATGASSSSSSSGELLATSLCTPAAMQRPVWRMEDYALSRRLYRGRMASVYKVRGAAARGCTAGDGLSCCAASRHRFFCVFR
jgi:hypothetical protein